MAHLSCKVMERLVPCTYFVVTHVNFNRKWKQWFSCCAQTAEEKHAGLKVAEPK